MVEIVKDNFGVRFLDGEKEVGEVLKRSFLVEMKQQSIFRFFERNEAKKFDNKLKIDGYSVKYSQLTPFAAIQYFNEMVNKSVE